MHHLIIIDLTIEGTRPQSTKWNHSIINASLTIIRKEVTIAVWSSRHPFPPFPSDPHNKSWSQIASSLTQTINNSPLHNEQLLNKLKASTTSFIKLDVEAIGRGRRKFQHALYGKLFGKPPPFDQVKYTLLSKWAEFGEIFISDLPNGFLLIRCSTKLAMKHILLGGPWSVNGIILQLSLWKPFFEPTFAQLNTAAIWVQFHNLPVECWDGETLETIAGNFGNLIEIDEFTSSLARSRFARVYIESDLSKPICRGFWLGDDLHRVFVVVMYERLPIFCYNCGLVGHGSKSCACSESLGAGGIKLPTHDVRVPVEDSI